jgi:hypothetical protein
LARTRRTLSWQALARSRRLGFGSLLAFIDAIIRIDRPLRPLGTLRNIDHRPARADAGNIDHRERLAGRNAGRQRRPDGARRQLWKARRHLGRQALIGSLGIDRVDGKPLIGTPAPFLWNAPAGIDRRATAITGQMTRALGTIPPAFGATAAPTGKPLAGTSAFIDAVVRIDRASRVIEVNWCNPN